MDLTRLARAFAFASCIFLALAAPSGLAQEDPAAATRALLEGRDTPFPALSGVRLLGAYEGRRPVGSARIEVGPAEGRGAYRFTARVEVELGDAKQEIETEATLDHDLTALEYKQTVIDDRPAGMTSIEDQADLKGGRWLASRRVFRTGGESGRERGEVELAVGTLPDGLAPLIPILVAGSPPGSRFAFSFFDGRAVTYPAEYQVVERRRIAVASRAEEAVVVRLTRTLATGVVESTDYFVSAADGSLLSIRLPAVHFRFVRVEESDLGKELPGGFVEEFDEAGRTPPEALLSLFDAMRRGDTGAVDAGVDYEEFFYRYVEENPPQAPVEGAGPIEVPREVLREQWLRRREEHRSGFRGRFFSARETPEGDAASLAPRLSSRVERNEARITLEGRAGRTWVLSRESGLWMVVGYREK
ncbi:MAG: hypothetical protein HY720_00665 [Planctomycetes bacterium]|nr:hypothetical protein [Planctomycetota bacterium]